MLRPITLRLRLLAVVISSLIGSVLSGQQPATKASVKGNDRVWLRPPDPLNAAAFDHFYDMDYDASVQEFTLIHKRHPDDPDAVNHLLTVVLFRELYRIGALSSG